MNDYAIIKGMEQRPIRINPNRRQQPAQREESQQIVPQSNVETFNFLMALPGRASSHHTHRAYFRWVDQYLVDVGGLKPTRGDARIRRMSALPVYLRDQVTAKA